MPTISDKDARQNARLRVHHLNRVLGDFHTLLKKERAEDDKAAGLMRRGELATLFGIPSATGPVSQRDFERAVDRRVEHLLRERARRVWWRRLLRWLRTERTLIDPDASYHPR